MINFIAFNLGKGVASKMIVIFSSINLLLIVLGIITKGEFAFWCILGTGLFFSIGWSNIFTLSIRGLKNLTSQGSSLLVMAIVGGAVLPYAQSLIFEKYNVQILKPRFLHEKRIFSICESRSEARNRYQGNSLKSVTKIDRF